MRPPGGGATIDDRNPTSHKVHYTTIIPRILVGGATLSGPPKCQNVGLNPETKGTWASSLGTLERFRCYC